MTPPQITALKKWLSVENLTYAQAGARLRERFNVSLGHTTISRFWYTYCQTTVPPRHDQRSRVFLDVILQSSKPIRVRILEINSRLSFKVGRMRQRGLDKKHTFFIGPDPEHEANP